MHFFNAQRQAKRNPTRLMVLFGGAVVALTAFARAVASDGVLTSAEA